MPSCRLAVAIISVLSLALSSPTVNCFVADDVGLRPGRRILPGARVEHASSVLGMKPEDANGWLSSDESDSADDDGLVTKEMLMKEMLADPKVKRKKKNGRYRTFDNRDSLPFVVQVSTPDPYTNKEDMKREARKNTKRDREKMQKSKKKKNGLSRHNLVGMDTRDGIASSIYAREIDGSLHKVLGEFTLDKNTNCGDLIEIGDQEFEVQKARCQYKYAGGKRFIMVRKILEVKEVQRLAEENFLKRQLKKETGLMDDDSIPPLQ